MVLGNLSVPGCPTNMDYSRARPIVLSVGEGGGCFGVFFLSSILSLFLPPL